MNDEDEITFGKYSGTKIKDVPACYLLWLWENGIWRDNTLSQGTDPVREYIVENFNALETECSDFIIQHRPRK